MIGTFLAGLVYGIIALIISKAGYRWIMNLLPPIVVGPVIIVIGLSVAPTAVGMAMNNPAGKYSMLHFSAALVTLSCNNYFLDFCQRNIKHYPDISRNYRWLSLRLNASESLILNQY